MSALGQDLSPLGLAGQGGEEADSGRLCGQLVRAQSEEGDTA